MKTIKTFEQYHKLNESVDMTEINSMIDYTQLDPAATEDAIVDVCEKADQLGVKSVCVLPKMVGVVAEELTHSDVLVCTVVSFPHGTDTPEQKLSECKKCIADGADEVDMVLNYPFLKENAAQPGFDDGDDNYIYLVDEIANLADECHKHTNKNGEPIVLKVIVESGLLSLEETEAATYICLEAGADFIKTSTGKVAIGAELDKVKAMGDVIDSQSMDMQIKASGGIRTIQDVQTFLPYVDRLGIGYAAVDKMNGIGGETKSSY